MKRNEPVATAGRIIRTEQYGLAVSWGINPERFRPLIFKNFFDLCFIGSVGYHHHLTD